MAPVSHLPPQTKTHLPLIGPHCRTHFITKRFFCFLSIEGLFRGRLLQNVLTNMYYVVIKRLGLLKCCVCVRPSLSFWRSQMYISTPLHRTKEGAAENGCRKVKVRVRFVLVR